MTRIPRLLTAAAALLAVATAAAPGWSPYVVRAGDTLWQLAQNGHVTVSALKAANGLAGDTIYIGQRLDIPGNGIPATAELTQGRVGPPPAAVTYTVRPGDTLTAVAQAHSTDVGTLARLNHLSGDLVIVIGQHLTLPAPPAGVFAAVPRAPQFAAAIAASSQTLASRADPGGSAVRQMVTAEAQRQGVDPSLALAVAYQESGFAQRMVSGTDAVGVMQLEPYTASWLASFTGTALDRYDVSDNIRGGVTLLRLLRGQADLADSIGGYYQGLASIRAHKQFADTQAYVRSVEALQARFR